MEETLERDGRITEPTDMGQGIHPAARIAEELDVLAILIDGVACATEALENSEDALPMAMYYELAEVAERVRQCSAGVLKLTNNDPAEKAEGPDASLATIFEHFNTCDDCAETRNMTHETN